MRSRVARRMEWSGPRSSRALAKRRSRSNWSREYEYDWANRLDVARHYLPQGNLKATWDYAFNEAGNITFNSEWSGGGLDGSYSYTGAGPHAVTQVGGASSPYTLSYDANGSLTAEGLGNWFDYNFDGRTSRMGDTGVSPDPSTELTYDPFGETRVRKVWTPQAGDTKDRRYFGSHFEELVEGAVHNNDKYVIAFGRRVAMRTTRDPGHTYYIHGDQQGNVSLVTDENGAVVDRRNYAPFGAPLDSEGTSPAARYGYTGQELDEEVGQLHLGIRQYNFAIARFGTGDPIAHASRPTHANIGCPSLLSSLLPSYSPRAIRVAEFLGGCLLAASGILLGVLELNKARSR